MFIRYCSISKHAQKSIKLKETSNVDWNETRKKTLEGSIGDWADIRIDYEDGEYIVSNVTT